MKFIIASIVFLCLLSSIFSEKKKIIYLIRNGEPKVRGIINTLLTEEGIAHCKAAGDFLSNEKIGKIYYSGIQIGKETAKLIEIKHSTKVEMIEEHSITDIFWEMHESKTYQEDFKDDNEKLIILEGESFYALMNRLRLFLIKFWESDEEECTIVTQGTFINILSLMFLQAPVGKFGSLKMFNCGVSKIQMKNIYSFVVEYWNAHYFFKDGEKKYLNYDHLYPRSGAAERLYWLTQF